MKCRHCGQKDFVPFADLDYCPPSNSMLTPEDFGKPEVSYPLNVMACTACWLVQVDEHKAASEIFNDDYTYFSSYSKSWLAHCEKFAAQACDRFALDGDSLVVEVASNDGYLLQYFQQRGVPVIGVEPTANTAAVAQEKNIETIVDFFGEDMALRHFAGTGRQADLICGNNVYAHVPDINDFTRGLKAALASAGVISLEFPHLLKLIQQTQFDTIYHEHFSYLSLETVSAIFASYGLTVFDVDELETHGGSLRVFGCHSDNASRAVSDAVAEVIAAERDHGLRDPKTYAGFQLRINEIRADFLGFLLAQRRSGNSVAGYGAAAKGNTLLNYCGVKGTELIEFVCDASPHKQGRLLPGSHIPVRAPEAIAEEKPDYVLILPWNLKSEIMQNLAFIREWDGKFVTVIPRLQVL